MEKKLNYIYPQDISFFNSDNSLLMAKTADGEVGRCAVLRMFPLEHCEEYLCVKKENYERSDRETEIGIIKDLKDFPREEADLVREELKKRYFAPNILTVEDVKEEAGSTFWKVKTDAGDTEFTLNDMSNNILNTGNNRIMLTDVYGNRFFIPDITKVGDKAQKILEIWI